MNGIWDSLDPGGEMSAGLTIPPAQLGSQITGNFPAGAFEKPSPVKKSWLSSLWEPFDNFGQQAWQAGTKTVEHVGERLPDLLWGWGLRELGVSGPLQERTVQEGSGVSVTYSQAPHAGGEPIQPAPLIIPGQWPTMPTFMATAAGVPGAKIPTSLLVIGAGVIVLYFVMKR